MSDSDVDVLARLEIAIGQLADGTAPLDELVAAHGRALKLLAEAEDQLQALRSRADEISGSIGA